MKVRNAPHRVVTNNFLALSSGEAAARILAFGTTIYIARTLGAEFYGMVGFALAVMLYLSRIVDLGMEHFGLGVREIAEDRGRINTLAPDLLATRIVVAVVVAGLIGVAGFVSREQPDGLVLGLYGLTLLVVGAGTRWIHLGLESTRTVAIARVVGEGSVVLLVLAMVRDASDVARVPMAQLIGDGAAALVLFWFLRRRGYSFPLRLRWAVVAPVFKRAAPLIVSTLLGLLIYNSDLIFLRFFRDAATVGYYAAAYTLVSFMINLGGAYSQSLMPTLTRVGPDGTTRASLYQGAVARVFAVTLPIAVGGSMLAPQIIRLVFGAAYEGPSGLALQLLLWTVPVALLREVSVVALVVSGSPKHVLRVTAGAAAVCLTFNLLLIPRFGIVGAAVATGITELVRLILALAYMRVAGLPLAPPHRLWRPLMAAAAMVLVLLNIESKMLWWPIGLGAITYGAALMSVERLSGLRRSFWLIAFAFIGSASGCTRTDGRQTPGDPVTIRIDPAQRFQTITAWESSGQAGQERPHFRSYRDTLFALASNDLGITRVRLEVRSGAERSKTPAARAQRQAIGDRCGRYYTDNDNDDPHRADPDGFDFSELDSTVEEVVLPWRRKAEASGRKLDVNLNYVAFMGQCPSSVTYHHADAEEYAEFITTVTLHLRDKYNLIPDFWEVILEPENTAKYWTGTVIGKAIVATARRLEAEGFKPRFIAPSTTKAANAPRFFDEMIAVEGVLPYVAELSYHRYRGVNIADIEQIAERARRYHINTSMLEHIGSGAPDLQEDLTIGQVSAWQQYVLAYPTEDNGAQYYVVDKGENPEVKLSSRGRRLRQYFHYVRPGAVRIQSESDDSVIRSAAFINADEKAVAIITVDRPRAVSISGLPQGSYSARFTSEAKTNEPLEVRAIGDALQIVMPERGIVTVFAN